ncbi:uncharacterized protein TNCV_1436051 [Trichonephila clavipes]|nr:uncharacterized protein TNCV_1436051 [Trichonephila clavipes]
MCLTAWLPLRWIDGTTTATILFVTNKGRLDLGTFRSENEYLTHHSKMITLAWRLLEQGSTTSSIILQQEAEDLAIELSSAQIKDESARFKNRVIPNSSPIVPKRKFVYRVSQNDHINSAQLDSSLGVHKNCPKKHSCTIHSLREKYEKQTAIQRLWFQHDGAPAHFCAPVRDWLDIAYPSRWNGRTILWSPRSPDLTSLDFFQWDHFKELVYRDVVTTQMDLVARLYSACTSVDPAVPRHVMTAIPRRAQACLDMHGGHFKHLP